jgi:drug/metabolite transporter (DMT)-like permease
MAIVRYAMLSGVLGASASCLAKLAFAADSPIASLVLHACHRQRFFKMVEMHYHWLGVDVSTSSCQLISYVPRGFALLLMIVLNAFMIGSFLEGLEESGSVAATALASASNFAVSALFGFLVWHETFTFQWLAGFLLVLLGVFLLSTVKLQTEKTKTI